MKDDSGSFAVFIHRARFICVTNDSSKSNGCHSKATRMRRTSSRRSISLHPGQNGRCTIVIENSLVRMSRYVHSTSQTQLAEIMVQHGRPSRSPGAKSVRSSSGRTFGERQFENVLLEHGWQKVPN